MSFEILSKPEGRLLQAIRDDVRKMAGTDLQLSEEVRTLRQEVARLTDFISELQELLK